MCPIVPLSRGRDSGTLTTLFMTGLQQAMFSLRSNGLPCRGKERKGMMEQRQGKRRGRPKSPPDTVRRLTIGVRVNSEEWRCLQRKAAFMGMPPARWLRIAALARRLPPPPVPAITEPFTRNWPAWESISTSLHGQQMKAG